MCVWVLQGYRSGKLASSEVKNNLIEILQQLVCQHQENRSKVTDEAVKQFMTPRKLELSA
jgi:tryptophanyl-tRNA synthetase